MCHLQSEIPGTTHNAWPRAATSITVEVHSPTTPAPPPRRPAAGGSHLHRHGRGKPRSCQRRVGTGTGAAGSVLSAVSLRPCLCSEDGPSLLAGSAMMSPKAGGQSPVHPQASGGCVLPTHGCWAGPPPAFTLPWRTKLSSLGYDFSKNWELGRGWGVLAGCGISFHRLEMAG